MDKGKKKISTCSAKKAKASKWTKYWHKFCREASSKKWNPDSRRHATKNLKESCSENQQNSIGKSEKM